MVLNRPLEKSSTIGFQIHVENVGREPAFNGVYTFNYFLAPYITGGNSPDVFQENTTCRGLKPAPHSGITIYPGTVKFWIPYSFEDKKMIAYILERKGSLVVEGCIAFLTFGQRHTSEFRFFLRDTLGPSCWAAKEGITTLQGVMQCWNFNGMLRGSGPD